MMFFLPALLLAVTARAAAPEITIEKAMTRIDGLVAQEPGHDRRVIESLDQRAEAAFADIKPLGWRAAKPLGAVAKDLKRPVKTRLFAVTFLSRLNDPAVFPPLSSVLLDPEQDPDLRLAAAQGLNALNVPPQVSRRTFCSALSQNDLPRLVSTETLIALTRLGCDDASALTRAARAYGPRPKDVDLADVKRSLNALGVSRGEDSARALLALLNWFPAESAGRAAAIAALAPHRADLSTWLKRESFPVIRDALRSESAEPASMVVLIDLMDAFGPEADDILLPLASHPDPEVLAVCAEALARRKAVKALPTLEDVYNNALNDPRFAPKPGRPDPAEMLSRLEAAVALLRRARAVAR